jgi:Beta galactosidase small chain
MSGPEEERLGLGAGARPPRAWGRSDAQELDLSGVWRFRPWTSEHLDRARHPTDLRPDDRIWVNLDLAQQGIGSASCGPGVLPAHRLDPAPASLTVRLYPGPAGARGG